jgi:hypothetical protein
MLGSAHVSQVAGDDRSRSFRPADAQGTEVRPSAEHLLEGFHWGRWTSGSWTQALWILLIPFGILNAAQFMLPGPQGRASRLAHGACGVALRLMALVLTVLFALGTSEVLVDLVAWQWLGRRDIRVPDWLFVGGALLLAALVVFLLSWIGQTHRHARYCFRVAEHGRPARWRPPGLEHASFFDGDPDSPTLRRLHRAAGLTVVATLGLTAAATAGLGWASGWRTGALVVLLTTVGVVLGLGDPEHTTAVRAEAAGAPDPGSRQERRSWRTLWHGPWQTAAQDLVPSSAARSLQSASGTQLEDQAWWRRLPRTASWLGSVVRNGLSGILAALLLGAAVALVGVAAVAVWRADATTAGPLVPEQGGLPGIGAVATRAGIAGTSAVLLLFVTVAWLALTTRESGRTIHAFRRFAGGMVPALAASIAFFLAIGLTAGLALSVQGALNRLPNVQLLVEVPTGLQRVSYAWGVSAAVVVALLLVPAGVEVLVRQERRRYRERVRSAMTFGGSLRLPDRWLPRVARSIGLARLKNHLVGGLWSVAVAGVLLAAAAVAAQLRARGFDVPFPGLWGFLTGVNSTPGEPVGIDDLVIGIGQATLLALAGGAVLLARGAIRAEGPRRALSVVWDVFAFWPRAVHPFVPPPYAQEVVPALVRRIYWHLGERDPLRDEGGPASGATAPPSDDGTTRNPEPAHLVVVAAHSQGSLIALTALLWLEPAVARRVRLLTFGSQLRQQYPRAFPHYVTVDLLRQVQRTHRWLSLYRDTDPIAGPVTSWDHEPDDAGELTSCRLESPDGVGGPGVPASRATYSPRADVVDQRTGRRECGSEWRLLDPAPDDRQLQGRAVTGIRGHSDYWVGPDWIDALEHVGAPVGAAWPGTGPQGSCDGLALGAALTGRASPRPAADNRRV